MHVAHRVQQLPSLRLNGLHNSRVGMPDVRHTKRSRQIEIAVAVSIPDVGSRGTLPKNRPMIGYERDVARFVTTQLAGEGAGLGTGNASLEEWQQVFHNNGFILAVLDELVKRLTGFLVHEQDLVIGFHDLNEFIDTQGLVIGLVAIEKYR